MTANCLSAERLRTLMAGLLSVSFAFTVAAAPAQETRTIEADSGTIEIPAAPQRIATMGGGELSLVG